MRKFRVIPLLALTAILLSSFSCLAQLDTIFTSSSYIACTVKEVEPEAVNYTFPNEEVVNSIYKNAIQRIVFRSGRVQVFAEALALKKVSGAADYQKVGITQSDYDVKGLYRLGEVSAKAKGATTISSMQAVKERAYRKMKMEAAMMGANIVYLAASSTNGNQQGSAFQVGNTTETNVIGIAYSNAIPDYDAFKKKMGEKREFKSVDLTKYDDNYSDLVTNSFATMVSVTEIFTENGLTILRADTKRIGPGRYRVISFDDTSFTLMFKKNGTIHNMKVNF